MPAPKGNQFWKNRTRHGRKKLFSDPEVLYKECIKYFEWCDKNPHLEEKAFAYMGTIKKTKVAKLRAYTLNGLQIYLNISDHTWLEYRKNKDFSRIISAVEKIIYEQKFNGAAANLLNARIISRDLGLKDHSQTDHTHKIATTEDPLEEMKKRGIPIPEIDIEDIEVD